MVINEEDYLKVRVIFFKILAAFFSVSIAGLLWLGLILLLKNSKISPLQTLAFYISHLTFIGWLLFGLLSIMIYLRLAQLIK